MTIGIMIGVTASGRRRQWSPVGKAGLYSWARGDDPSATINETPDPDQYSAIPDAGSVGGSFAQATSGNQPQVSTLATPGPAPNFTGTQYLQSDTTASDWAFTNAGVDEWMLSVAVLPTAVNTNKHIFATTDGAAPRIGFLLRFESTGLRVRVSNAAANGTGTHALDLSAAGLFSANTVHIITVHCDGTSAAAYVDGTEAASGTMSNPSASDPFSSAVLGNTISGVAPFIGDVLEHVLFKDTVPDRATLEAYLGRWSYTP